MIVKSITIPFKENRPYIQGPDLYNIMVEHADSEPIENIRFSTHEFIKNNHCTLYMTDELAEIEAKLPLPTHFTCRMGEKEKYLFIDENRLIETSPIRVSYDESPIQQICSLDHDSITISGTSPFSFMETVVSMKKALLTKLFPTAHGRWIFTKVNLKNPFEGQTDLKVTILHNMKFKLIKSSICYKSEILGHLFFSLVKT